MANVVRELITKLTVSGDGKKKMAQFSKSVDVAKKSIAFMAAGMAAASVAAFALVNQVTTVGDAVAKTSRQVGLTAKEFQRLSFAAERSGVPLVNLKKGLQNIQRNLRDAAIAAGKGKSNSFTTALDEVGLSLRDLQNLSAEDQIGLIGEALSTVADAGRRVALSQKLVGEEAGPRFASLLAEGREGVRALGDEAERLGIVLDGDALKASEGFQDSLTNMRSVITGVSRSVAVKLIPIVDKGVKAFTSFLLANRKVIEQKMDAVVSKLGDAFSFLLDNASRLFDFLDTSIVVLETAVRWFIEFIDAVGGLDKAVAIAAVTWGVYAVAQGAALAPILAVTAVVIGLAAAFGMVADEADEARRAEERFGKTKGADSKFNPKLARSDARAVLESFDRGDVPSDVFIDRLIGRSGLQQRKTLDIVSGKLTARAARSRKRSGGGKSGIGGRLGDVGAEESSLLRVFEEFERIVKDRSNLAAAPTIEPESDADFINKLTGFTGEGTAGGVTGTGGGGGTPGTKAADTGPGLDELIAQAIQSGVLPEAAVLLASTTPPIIIPITNINVEMQVDAPVTVNGVPGEEAEGVSDRVIEAVQEALQVEFTDAMDQLRPQLSR